MDCASEDFIIDDKGRIVEYVDRYGDGKIIQYDFNGTIGLEVTTYFHEYYNIDDTSNGRKIERIEYVQYDDKRNVTAESDYVNDDNPREYKLTYSYVATYDNNSNIQTSAKLEGNFLFNTKFEYDEIGKLSRETIYKLNCVENCCEPTSIYEYINEVNNKKQTLTMTIHNNNISVITTDKLGRVVHEEFYDHETMRISEMKYSYLKKTNKITKKYNYRKGELHESETYKYDDNENLIEYIGRYYEVGTKGKSSEIDEHYFQEFDNNGNMIHYKSNCDETFCYYDDHNNHIRSINKNGEVVYIANYVYL